MMLVVLLPFARSVRRTDLDSRHFIFRAVRRPVRMIGGDDVGLGQRMVERRVDHAGRTQSASRTPRCSAS